MLPKNCEIWLPGLVQHRLARARRLPEACHIHFCLVDHYEPGWRGADLDLQRERVSTWTTHYPNQASRHRDIDGRPPQHTFFFPTEEYQPEHLDALASLAHAGWGDVEVHLHHDRDTPAGFRENLSRFTEILHVRHGLLRKDAAGRIRYGFIHGDWALNNARPDGLCCGVDDETSILLETGCYADFTMPCGPKASQSRKVNAIYYMVPQDEPRAQDHGMDARAGAAPPGGLLIVQGPLALNWFRRKWGILPRIDTADIAWHTPATPDRIRLWAEQQIHVQGAGKHIFIKVSTHGAQERNMQYLLFGGLNQLWCALEEFCRRGAHSLHYVTAYEMQAKIHELETGTLNQPAMDAARLATASGQPAQTA
jgi:hypothetical protein